MVWQKRRITLVNARFQLKVVGAFLAISLLCMLIQMFLLSNAITAAQSAILEHPQSFNMVIRGILWQNLLIAFGLLVPFSIAIGIMVTFRIAGPITCFEEYFRELEEGSTSAPCRIRDNDEFQSLCKEINEALEARRIISDNSAQTF